MNISYGNIAEWLINQGFEIGEHVLRNHTCVYKKRIEERQKAGSINEQNKSDSLIDAPQLHWLGMDDPTY